MTNVFIYILISSVMCSLCAASVLLLNRLFKGVSQRFKCGILTLAVLLPYVGIAVTPFVPAKMTAVINAALYSPEVHTTAVDNTTAENAVMTGYAPSAAAPARQSVSIDFVDIAAWIWLAGTAVMLAYSVIRHIRLKRVLRSDRKIVKSIGIIAVYSVSMSVSPFLIGIFKPAIYIPTDAYSEEELKLVIAHETAHYRRGDLYRRLLVTLLNCVNWFNPVYRYALKKLVLQTELACDEAVTVDMSEETAKAYGYMLLKTAENGIKNEYLTVGLGGDAENLKRRIGTIMMTNKTYNKRAGTIACVAFAVSALLCIGGCGAGMAVIEPETEPENAVVWWNEYFEDPSQVPESIKVGRYYREGGTEDEYVEVFSDGTMQMFGHDHIKELIGLNGEETINTIMASEEGRKELEAEAEYWNGRHEYVYIRNIAFIAYKDPLPGEETDRGHSSLGFSLTSEDTIAQGSRVYHYRPQKYKVNQNGQSYGTLPEGADESEFPDMIPAVGDNGKEGYVYVSDLNGDIPSSPEEAMKIRESMDNGTYKPRTINVYDIDGKTIIDTFTEKTNTMDQVVQNEDGTYTFIGE